MNVVRRGLLLLALCAGVAACCRGSTERKTGKVASPDRRFLGAYAEVWDKPSFYKNGHQHPPSVTHVLILEWPDGINHSNVFPVIESEGHPTPRRFDELRKVDYTLRFAPDAHALAASIDGGRAWALFDLDVLANPTEKPFWCRHKTVTSLDPWPSSRALALEVLAAADPASPAAHAHRGAAAIEWPTGKASNGDFTWRDEVDEASRYVCVKRDDAELRRALVDAYVRPGDHARSIPMERCVGELARTDEALRVRLKAAVTGADDETRKRIEGVLSHATRK
jgi:hypothetical protein